MTSPIDINPGHLEIVRDILRKNLPSGVTVWVFGSRANWSTNDSSDLDLALEGNSVLDHSTITALEMDFEASSLPYTVDVVDLNRVTDNFRQIVEVQRTHLPLNGEQTIENDKWKRVTVEEFSPFAYGKSLPAHKRNTTGLVPVFGSNGIIGYHDLALTAGPTVIVGRKGTVGSIHYSNVPCWPIDTTFFFTASDAELTKFKYYVLGTLGFNNMNSDSAVPGLNRSASHAKELHIPTEYEQRRIVHILGSIDDKIELNCRMNHTLDVMARTLFKSWFVDFDPVRAKMDGRWRPGESLPGLPAYLYDMFPDGLVDSELGAIPERWEVKKLATIARQRKSTVKPADIDSNTHYIALKHMPKRCIALSEWSLANGLASNKYRFKQGDILFGKLRPYFHKIGVAPLDGICSTDIVVVYPILKDWFGLVLCYMSSSKFINYTNTRSTGTKMPRTNWNDMASYNLVFPGLDLAKYFTNVIRLFVDKIISTIHNSRALVAKRDALLPKLLSGDLRIPLPTCGEEI